VISPSAPPAAAILRTLRRVGGDEFVDMTISCSLFKAPPVKCRARPGGMSFQCMRVDGYAESIDGRHGSRGKGWWDWRGKMLLLLDVLVAKSLPQSRDCKIKEGAQLQRHRALAGVDNADRHR
jgi:hypothetical protein